MSYLNHFRYEISGTAGRPKLVFLHGLLGSLNNWQPIVREFSEYFEILTFDQRGHGQSYHPPDDYSPADYAKDLNNILEELAWPAVHLVGHSMGARNALVFASQYSGRCLSLVMEDMGPEAQPAAGRKIERMLKLVPVPFEDRKMARAFFTDEFPRLAAEHSFHASLGPYLYMNLTRAENGQVTWRFSMDGVIKTLVAGRDHHYWHEWQSLSCPCLVIRGEHSTDLPHDIFQKMLDTQKRSCGMDIGSAGHWVHHDQPQAFIDALRKFWVDQCKLEV